MTPEEIKHAEEYIADDSPEGMTTPAVPEFPGLGSISSEDLLTILGDSWITPKRWHSGIEFTADELKAELLRRLKP